MPGNPVITLRNRLGVTLGLSALVVALAAAVPALAQEENEEDGIAFESDAGPASPDIGGDAPPPLPKTNDGPPPLPPTLPPYYIAVDGQQIGPLSQAQLRVRAAGGDLSPTTLVWTGGMGDWQPASEVAELAFLLPDGSGDDTNADVSGDDDDDAMVADAFDPQGYVVGTWSTQGMIPIPGVGQGQANLQQMFNADGSMRVSGTVSADIAGSGMPTDVGIESNGTWSVTPMSDTQFSMTMVLTTTMSAPALGVPPQTDSSTESSIVVVVDENTIRDSEGVMWMRQ